MAVKAVKKEPTRAQKAVSAFDAWAKSGKSNDRPVDLKRVARLAQRQLLLEDDVAKTEDLTKNLRQQLFDVRCLELPEALSDAGLSEFTLSTGEKVKLGTEYQASLAGEKKLTAIRWLEENGYGSLISVDLTVALQKGQDALATKIKKLLEKTFKKEIKAGLLNLELVENVNTTSFKALIRERLEDGETIPVEELGVVVQDATKITRPKKPTLDL